MAPLAAQDPTAAADAVPPTPVVSTLAAPPTPDTCTAQTSAGSRPLALLTRKPSFVEPSPLLAPGSAGAKQTSKPKLAAVPHLQPVALTPERLSPAAPAFSFLDRVDRIEINGVRERDGVTYYVLDVFLAHSRSRLPTHAAQRCNLVRSTAPDVQVERRFSDFRRLRSQVNESMLIDPQCVCAYCVEFIVYMRLTMHQPRAITKLTTGTKQRTKLLAAFINDFVRLGRCRHKQNHACRYHEPVPHLIEAFVRGDAAEAEPSSAALHS